MKARNAKVLVCVIIATTLVMLALPALAGSDSNQPMFWMGIEGLDGWQGSTASYLTAYVPPFENGIPSNVVLNAPNSEQFTVAYWVNEGLKLSSQTLTTVYPSSDFQFEGIIEVGVNDIRTSLNINWFVENANTPWTWMVQLYRRDTHSLVLREFIEPYDPNNWFSYSITTSRPGYDLLVAAWDDNPNPVPEPGSISALGFGLMALLAMATRIKYKH